MGIKRLDQSPWDGGTVRLPDPGIGFVILGVFWPSFGWILETKPRLSMWVLIRLER